MTNKIIEQAESVFAKTYKRFPIVIKKGKGCTVTDTEGNVYTDFTAGIAVCNLGHAHPRIAKVIAKQAETLFHVSNLYYTVPQIELADILVRKSFADRVFLCNSGAEANEAAIKLARKYSNDKGEKNRYKIIAMKQSFHGRTMAALSATGQDKIKKGFDPVLSGFDFADFNNIKSLQEKIDDSVCAVFLEPIQGEGGVVCPEPEYLKQVRRICDKNGILLIFDEVQTGIGRTGKLFAYENFNVEPDIMTLAKALANGLPVGAMLSKEGIAESFSPGSHATTFGGTPVISSAAAEVLKIIDDDNIIALCRKTGEFFKQKLTELKQKHDCIEEIRGMGLLLGLKLKENCEDIVLECMKKGFLINCIQGNILRFVPPLIIDKDSVNKLTDCLDEVLP